MTRKNILMILPIMFSILLIPSIGLSFAEHGHDESSGGGGCSGDCTPPTLGQDSSGRIHVTGGFTINEKTYDVGFFEQTIPTQIVKTGEPVEITLKIFENSGPQYLKHVELVLGNEHIFDSYVWRQMPTADIAWQQTFDGIESIEITNPDNLITDVNVEAEIDGTFTVLKFQFTPTTTFDTSHMMVKTWDQNRSYWLNNFYDALEISITPFSQKNNDVLTTESGSFGETLEVHEVSIESHEDEVDKEKTHEDEDSHDTKLTEEIHCDEDQASISPP